MSIYGYTNEAGEPIMSGEAWRFEQALDADAAFEPYDPDQFLAYDYDEDDYEDDEDFDYDPREDFGHFGDEALMGE